MVIFICGFMGSGKSTFLKKLKDSCPREVEFIDTDIEINRRYNQADGSLGEWIESVGWDFFRRVESDLIQEYLSSSHKVIALGGGSLSHQNLNLIQSSSAKLVWLKTPYELCYKRILGDTNRPLVKKGEAYLGELYKKREFCYAQSNLHLEAEAQAKVDFLELLKLLKLDG